MKPKHHSSIPSITGKATTECTQAEETLRESEKRFHAAFDRGAIAMAIAALDGRFMQVNPALCKMLGYNESELLARTFFDITHPDDLDRNRAGGRGRWLTAKHLLSAWRNVISIRTVTWSGSICVSVIVSGNEGHPRLLCHPHGRHHRTQTNRRNVARTGSNNARHSRHSPRIHLALQYGWAHLTG